MSSTATTPRPGITPRAGRDAFTPRAPTEADDNESVSGASVMSRPKSPGESSRKGGSKASIKVGGKAKKGVRIDAPGGSVDADGTAGVHRQLHELQGVLRQVQDELAVRTRAQTELEHQLQQTKEQHTNLVRLSAKRLIQISTLERDVEAEKARNRRMMDELVKQTKMMDLVINFRDQECARDVNELTHENAELSERADLWMDRAQMLQQERWSFVQKFRGAHASAKAQSAETAFDAMGKAVDPDDDSDEEGGDDDGAAAAGGDDDDW